jgi:hypothetical protein
MADIIYVLVTLVFFAICWTFVRGCERIVRSAEDEPAEVSP